MRSTVTRWIRFLKEDLWALDLRSRPPLPRFGLAVLRVAVHVVIRFSRSLASLQAAGLTLMTLLALVPLLALMFAIGRALGYGVTLDQSLQELAAELPEHLQVALEQVRQLVLHTDFGTLGALGTLVVLWSGLVLFSRTEQAFNMIWRTPHRRRWIRRVSDFVALLVLVPPLALGALVLRSVLGGVETIEGLRSSSPWMAWLYEASLGFVPHVMLWVAFTALYRLMPSARVRWSAAAVGGVVAGSAVVFVHGLYIEFQVGVARANAIYATLAALPLLLIYLQLLWTIVLIGAEISYAVQNLHTLRSAEQPPPPTPSVRRRLALHLMQRASEGFRCGRRGVRLSELAMALDVPGEWIAEVAADLESAGLLVEVRGVEDLVMPARPPERIEPAEVLAAVEGLRTGVLDRVRLDAEQEAALAEAEQNAGRALSRFAF